MDTHVVGIIFGIVDVGHVRLALCQPNQFSRNNPFRQGDFHTGQIFDATIAQNAWLYYSVATMAKIAIIETGGKQYVVTTDTILDIEKLPSGAKKDGKVIFDKVLLTDDGKDTAVGSPYVSGAKVAGEILAEGRDKKITVVRYRQKSRYFKKKGHRQPFTKVRITALP